MRDELARVAMQAILSDPALDVFSPDETESIKEAEEAGEPHHTTDTLAKFCYDMADAMLRARARK